MEILGKLIGRYEITQHIGAGAMAEVYQAYDPDIDRTVALKILKEENCVNEEHINRFLREGKAAGALTHPNIVTIHDVGTLESVPYIMMELLEGQPLSQLLQSGDKLPLTTVLRIAMQIADALDYAHDKGVVHRDVKPDNVIVGKDGTSIKIADFGIARLDEGAKESTQAGMILGTPRYMSPEQASGESVDGRSDLFSLGVILYEMLTGQKAFDAESMATLIMQIMQKDPPPIRNVVTQVPPGLQNIVAKLLAKKPARRYQSGRELHEALARELRLLEEDESEKSAYMPLQVKWTAIMATVVAVAMALSSIFIMRAQTEALQQQAIDSGISLGNFVAVQAAVPVLSEDWITLESFVEDASNRKSFAYLVVADHEGVVRSATQSELVGGRWNAAAQGDLLFAENDVEVRRLLDADENEIFNFNLPILFRDTRVGSVDVGVDQAGLNAAQETTAQMLTGLALAIVAAVVVVIYVFNQLVAKNLLLSTQALRLFRQGNLEARISRERTDEFGDLFKAFNEMADAVKERLEGQPELPSGPAAAVADHNSQTIVPDADTELDISGIAQATAQEQTIIQTSVTDSNSQEKDK
ncbi:MAG: protein kinase [Pseudomonadota bacterium]